MIGFWIAAAGLSAAVAALVLRGAARGLAPAGDDPALAVHRRQLSEIDELAERGLLAEGELKAARAEAGRRLLAAADQSAAWPREGLGPRRVVVTIAALAPLLALGLYVVVGAPGAPDQPFARRVAEWKAGDPAMLDPPRIVAILEQAARGKDGANPELYRNLAIARMAGGDAVGAAEALRKAVRLAPQRADLWTALGEAFVTSEQGQVGADARTAFTEALKRDPGDVSARYHLAKALIADGRVEEGLAGWRQVRNALGSEDPRRDVLDAEIARTAKAGRLVDAVPQQAAAGEVTPDMIQGMVEGLAQRLAAAPDDPEGWVRLVRAYAVLGDAARRDAALKDASQRFKDQPRVLAALRQAADTPAQNLNLPRSDGR
ncbi:cytochrome C biogenesis protein CycH [Caulobacter vibrioides]|nr:cytochrome C biogenesis protein CycH [Caulobacter vibrioides]